LRILVCLKGYQRIITLLEELLPEDEIVECDREEIASLASEFDVLVPIVAPLPEAVYASVTDSDSPLPGLANEIQEGAH